MTKEFAIVKKQAKHIIKNTGYIGNEVGIAFDVSIKSMEKLEKIEQIMNKESEGYIQNNSCLREIREVLNG